MTIEADYYYYRNKSGRIKGPRMDESISAGSSKKIDLLKPSEFRIFNQNDQRGVIYPENVVWKVKATLFDEFFDEKGYLVLENGFQLDLSTPIEMQRGEVILLEQRGKRTTKELLLYFDDDDDSQDEVLSPPEPDLVAV